MNLLPKPRALTIIDEYLIRAEAELLPLENRAESGGVGAPPSLAPDSAHHKHNPMSDDPWHVLPGICRLCGCTWDDPIHTDSAQSPDAPTESDLRGAHEETVDPMFDRYDEEDWL